MTGEWTPRGRDIALDNVPDETRAYFREESPESITPMSVPDLHDALDPASGIEVHQDLYDLTGDIIRDCRRNGEPYKMSQQLEAQQHDLTSEYSYAIPTAEALDYLADYSPLAELFAGTGYWSYELEQRGCTVTAFDADPPHDTWADVTKSNQDALLAYAEAHDPVRLLMCWPPVGPAAYEALLIAQPDDVFFVGERPQDGFNAMANAQYFQLLDARYEHVTTLELPSLMGRMDNLHHYRRE